MTCLPVRIYTGFCSKLVGILRKNSDQFMFFRSPCVTVIQKIEIKIFKCVFLFTKNMPKIMHFAGIFFRHLFP